MYNKVIFVCTGNTCRSPMAEALFTSMMPENKIEVISRGMVVLFPEPINPKAEAVYLNHGIEAGERMSTQLVAEDITPDTLVLTMTASQKRHVLDKMKQARHVYTLKEYAGESGDVTDPYGKPLLEYEECFSELSRLVKKTIYKLYG